MASCCTFYALCGSKATDTEGVALEAWPQLGLPYATVWAKLWAEHSDMPSSLILSTCWKAAVWHAIQLAQSPFPISGHGCNMLVVKHFASTKHVYQAVLARARQYIKKGYPHFQPACYSKHAIGCRQLSVVSKAPKVIRAVVQQPCINVLFAQHYCRPLLSEGTLREITTDRARRLKLLSGVRLLINSTNTLRRAR